MTRKTIAFLAMTLLLALALVACGGGDNSGATNGGNTGDAAGETETDNGDGGEAVAAGDPAQGEELYQQTCSACHGPDATGLPNLGKDLNNNEFVQERSNQEMLEFIKQGRPAGDPLNDTGVDMPPKGGNPALADEDILHIIAYLRTLQE